MEREILTAVCGRAERDAGAVTHVAVLLAVQRGRTDSIQTAESVRRGEREDRQYTDSRVSQT